MESARRRQEAAAAARRAGDSSLDEMLRRWLQRQVQQPVATRQQPRHAAAGGADAWWSRLAGERLLPDRSLRARRGAALRPLRRRSNSQAMSGTGRGRSRRMQKLDVGESRGRRRQGADDHRRSEPDRDRLVGAVPDQRSAAATCSSVREPPGQPGQAGETVCASWWRSTSCRALLTGDARARISPARRGIASSSARWLSRRHRAHGVNMTDVQLPDAVRRRPARGREGRRGSPARDRRCAGLRQRDPAEGAETAAQRQLAEAEFMPRRPRAAADGEARALHAAGAGLRAGARGNAQPPLHRHHGEHPVALAQDRHRCQERQRQHDLLPLDKLAEAVRSGTPAQPTPARRLPAAGAAAAACRAALARRAVGGRGDQTRRSRERRSADGARAASVSLGIALAALLLWRSSFIVSEGEVGLRTRFGQAQRATVRRGTAPEVAAGRGAYLRPAHPHARLSGRKLPDARPESRSASSFYSSGRCSMRRASSRPRRRR